ncbi:MAG: ATP synthase F1 subunit epsilon [Verrucomicrobiales bacterium]
MPLQLEIVTPERKTFSDEVDSVVPPGVLGEMGILPNHAPLVSTIEPGALTYTKDGKHEDLAVGKGFVEITATSVSVLTDMAVSGEDIDEEAVEKALESARQALSEKDHDTNPEEIAAVQAMIQKSLAQLHVKRKRRTL